MGTVHKDNICTAPSLGTMQVLESVKGGLRSAPALGTALCLFFWELQVARQAGGWAVKES